MPTPEIDALRERARELRCLYRINAILSQRQQSPVAAFASVLEAIPAGWQRPATTGARIEYLGRSYVGPGFSAGGESLAESLKVWGTVVGRVEVVDTTGELDPSASGFLAEEVQLLRTIADRLGEFLEWKQTELLAGRSTQAADHWRWRDAYAGALAAALDAERFGVSAVYLGGSTENGDAGPGSDIDLFILWHGTSEQRRDLSLWLEGWSLGLAELAFQQTGYRFAGGILDVHWLDAAPGPSRRTELREIPMGASASAPR